MRILMWEILEEREPWPEIEKDSILHLLKEGRRLNVDTVKIFSRDTLYL